MKTKSHKIKHNKQLPTEQKFTSLVTGNSQAISHEMPEDLHITKGAYATTEDGTPYIREGWNEGNWNQDRPWEAVRWDCPEEIIKMCWNAYLYDPIVGNVIDLMTDFSVEGIEIQHPNKSVQSFLNNWWALIKGNKVLNSIFSDVFRTGICMVQKRTSKIDKALQNKIAQATGSLDEKKFPLPDKKLQSREIPHEYFTYDPRSIRVYGDETVGGVTYYIELDDNSVNALYGSDKEMINEALKNKTLVSKNGLKYEFLLPKDKIVYLAWRKASYSKYGLSFITRILESLLVKRKFLHMLRGASDNWLSAIRIWKLGQQKGGPETIIMPSRADYARLAKTIKSHQPGASLDVLWNFAIELEEHYAPVDKIFSSVPLDLINREIKYGLGVPDVLIDGSGGNFSNSFLAIKTLVERLEYARELIMSEFLMPELRMISESLGFRKLPIVKWGHINLRDEATILKLVLQLRDRKLISKESLLKEFDYNWVIEHSRILEEELEKTKKGPDDPMKDYGPFFIDNPPIAGGGKPGVNPSARGRPSGKSKPNTKRRSVTPKGQKTAALSV